MLKLYYSPGAVSLATHIALEEAGLPYSLAKVALRQGEHLTEAYRRIHPLQRIPALELQTGEVLTETPALLWYISDRAPQAEPMPADLLGRARATEWLSFLASVVHIAFASCYRPELLTSDSSTAQAMKAEGADRFVRALGHVEARLPERGFVLGERYSLCDAHAAVFFFWARRLNLAIAGLPRYGRLLDAVLKRPAARRALDQEGLSSS